MKSKLRKKFKRLDITMTVCMILAECLAIGRIWVAWNTYTFAASFVWTTVTIIISVVIILQLVRCHYSHLRMADKEREAEQNGTAYSTRK